MSGSFGTFVLCTWPNLGGMTTLERTQPVSLSVHCHSFIENDHQQVNGMASKVKAEGLVPDRKNCWEFFIKRIRKNLHVVLAFSPVGDDFRNRAKKFPALVNCTVIGEGVREQHTCIRRNKK